MDRPHANQIRVPQPTLILQNGLPSPSLHVGSILIFHFSVRVNASAVFATRFLGYSVAAHASDNVLDVPYSDM